ncbi:hypothetical protein N9Y37_06550 [Luminiphilus sp.]|nr:hypothetical protein [Luminiphilus sp.]
MNAVRLTQCVILVGFCWSLASCAVPSDSSGLNKTGNVACEGAPELIVDPLFSTLTDAGGAWKYRQHAGARSFSVAAQDGVLTFERVGTEPWGLFQQSITDERLRGATIRFTADLRGDVSPTVSHGFEAKAGLFLQIAKYSNAFMGDQSPKNGQWDWQTFSVTKTVPVGANSIQVGFIHQAGEGAIEARNPSLVLVDCAN